MAERLAPSSPGTCCNTSIYWTTEVRWWPCLQAIAIAANEHLAGKQRTSHVVYKQTDGEASLVSTKKTAPLPRNPPKKKPQNGIRAATSHPSGPDLVLPDTKSTWKPAWQQLCGRFEQRNWRTQLDRLVPRVPHFRANTDDWWWFKVCCSEFYQLRLRPLGTDSSLWRQSSTMIKCEHSDGKVQ